MDWIEDLVWNSLMFYQLWLMWRERERERPMCCDYNNNHNEDTLSDTSMNANSYKLSGSLCDGI